MIRMRKNVTIDIARCIDNNHVSVCVAVTVYSDVLVLVYV